MDEPIKTINGRTLTSSEAMTLRVAIESFALSLSTGLGGDDIGKGICEGYLANIRRLRDIIYEEYLGHEKE